MTHVMTSFILPILSQLRPVTWPFPSGRVEVSGLEPPTSTLRTSFFKLLTSGYSENFLVQALYSLHIPSGVLPLPQDKVS